MILLESGSGVLLESGSRLLPESGGGAAFATIRAALDPLLAADTTLATLWGGGVWFAPAPAGKSYPYGVFAEQHGQAKVNAGPSFYEYLDCRFSFYSDDDAAAEAFGAALLARLKAIAPVAGPTRVLFADGYLMGWRLLGRWTIPADRPLSPASVAWHHMILVRFTIGRDPA